MRRQSVQELNETGPATAEAVCLVDVQGRIVAADAAAGDWLEVLGLGPVADAIKRLFAGTNEIATDIELNIPGPNDTHVHIRLRRLNGDDGPLALVTYRLEAEAIVHDALTGLPDRRAIADRIAAWRGAGGGTHPPFAVLFLDLDGFKRINDEHGHAAGDRVLKTLAQRLVRCVRDEDLVARYGGDEFVLLLKDVAKAADAEPVIERLQSCARQAVDLGEQRLHVGATIGVAVSETPMQPVEELIAAADRDMYARKRRRPK
ncbi:MAG: GGDEF domain-containing protein [Pirellulales bacterium]|nr:GGDEF domain-containing protein [Pirellulales bacterium]